MIKCMIVEDNLLAMRSLERMCSKMDVLELAASCDSVTKALKVLEEERIDLIFLDIEMGDESGFMILDASPFMPEVIITSSKEDYAFEAFQYEVSHYLKKPIKLPAFKAAVQKVADKINSDTKDNKKDHIFIRSEGKYVNIKLADIIYVENIGDYVRFVLDGENHMAHGTLKSLISKLPEDIFMKVHRSFIVNLTKIKDIEDNSLLVGRKIIPVSRANKPGLMKKLNLI